MVWQHAGTYMEPVCSCAGLRHISPRCILNISKPSGVLKISTYLPKKTNKICFISDETDHFWLNIWHWCMVGPLRIWCFYGLQCFWVKNRAPGPQDSQSQGKFQILKLESCKKWGILRFFFINVEERIYLDCAALNTRANFVNHHSSSWNKVEKIATLMSWGLHFFRILLGYKVRH